jgi:hypothetical protein
LAWQKGRGTNRISSVNFFGISTRSESAESSLEEGGGLLSQWPSRDGAFETTRQLLRSVVAAWMGHATLTTTEIYTVVTRKVMRLLSMSDTFSATDLAPKFYPVLSLLWRLDLPCWAG